MFRCLKVQLARRFEIKRRRLSHEMDLVGAPVRGMPRYLDERELLGMPRILEMCNWTIVGVLKKKILDLSRFRVMPEALVKLDKMELSFWASHAVGEFMRRVSSTNWL
jgi:hypothetical protein